MTEPDLRQIHRSFGELSDGAIELLAATSEERHYDQGSTIFTADADADEFYVIRSGIVALEMPSPDPSSPLVIETLGPGELLGVSWAFPPYRWNWRAVAQTDVDAVAFDAARARDAAHRDPALRMALLEAVAIEAIDRLHATRMRLADIYGTVR